MNAFDLTDTMRRNCGLSQNDQGAWLCSCGVVLEAQSVECPACRVESQRLQLVAERERKINEWRSSIQSHAAFEGVPPWEWARITNSKITSLRGKLLIKAAQTYNLGLGSLILSARTGLGKTSCAVALLHRLRDAEIDQILASKPGTKPTETLTRLRYLVWTDGFSLAQARRQQPLGQGEARIVERAFNAKVLVIDEVGFEPLYDTVIAEIANARYVQDLPTIITTGLRPDEFRERYGDACYRRFAERGTVVEDLGTSTGKR